jgi:6-pyruvoyltetrahydropterin/6-carboxytetrahydropterin synthase
MPVITISRRFEWDAAHRIPGHEGACKAIHGHRYVSEVEVSGPQMDALGRIVDFGVLKSVVGAWIDTNFDHTAVFSRADPQVAAIAELNASMGRPVYWLDGAPTAEGLVAELARIIPDLLAPYGITLEAIKLWETPNCWALWRRS